MVLGGRAGLGGGNAKFKNKIKQKYIGPHRRLSRGLAGWPVRRASLAKQHKDDEAYQGNEKRAHKEAEKKETNTGESRLLAG